MNDYRDSDRAAREKVRVLEEELEAREAEAEVRIDEIEQQRVELRAKEAELRTKDDEIARLRAQLPAPKVGVRVCSQCGRENAAHYEFCLDCGTALSEDPVPAARPKGNAKRKILLWLVLTLMVVAITIATFFSVRT